jgi:hypothetical protein
MKLGNEIPVETVNLHQSAVIGGVQTDKTISQFKYKGIVMHLIPQGLHVEYGGEQYIIPHAAIASCKLKKEEEKKREKQ